MYVCTCQSPQSSHHCNSRHVLADPGTDSVLRAIFSRPFRLSLVPTICPWVSEDAVVIVSNSSESYRSSGSKHSSQSENTPQNHNTRPIYSDQHSHKTRQCHNTPHSHNTLQRHNTRQSHNIHQSHNTR